MTELHKAVSSSVLYRFFRYVVFLPAVPEPLENSLGACRLLVVTPLEGEQAAFDVKRTELLSENCTKLSTYSRWNDKMGFDNPVSPLELSPVVRNYWRRKLLVGYVEYSPFSVSRRPTPNGTLVYEGVDFSLIFNLARAFNMSLVPVRDPEATWGAKRHGRWTGIAGMVSRREVDLAVSASFQTPYREQVLDYAHYYYIQVVKFIVRAPAEKPRALVIVRPFAVEVWLGVLVAYLVSLALLLAVMRFERRHDRTGKLRFLPTQDVALSLYLGVIWQGCDWRFSGSPTRRLVAAGWWLLCTVISCAYCSLLISFMSHPGMEQALDTLPRLRRELLAGRIFVGTTRHTEMELAFTVSAAGRHGACAF
ncbi:glutamate receptor ionotropic, delta-1-like [Dermacentor variabilis]|uniref:glutamate receptor ionotropic, delta-1-like n=1 Tax=Dermacentor variabilis TaxID=34621 RepID=UPI003F5B2484